MNITPRTVWHNPKNGMALSIGGKDDHRRTVCIADNVKPYDDREVVGEIVSQDGKHWDYQLVGNDHIVRYGGDRRAAAWALVWAVLEARSPLTRVQARARLQLAS